jgi:hypothetical protein
MKSKIYDIKVIGPKDKLIIVPDSEQNFDPDEIRIVNNFLKSKFRVLFVEGCQVHIIQKGAKILLRKVLNKKLKEIKK